MGHVQTVVAKVTRDKQEQSYEDISVYTIRTANRCINVHKFTQTHACLVKVVHTLGKSLEYTYNVCQYSRLGCEILVGGMFLVLKKFFKIKCYFLVFGITLCPILFLKNHYVIHKVPKNTTKQALRCNISSLTAILFDLGSTGFTADKRSQTFPQFTLK